MNVLTATTPSELAVPRDDDKIRDIVDRLINLLDVEWRILDQAQYDLLPDITFEKNVLEEELHAELSLQRKAKAGMPHAGFIVDFEMVKTLREKLDRNNVRLKAKREACLKRIRAGWAATAADGSTSYNRRGDLRGKAKQKILSMKI
ncbi:hypothetical protein [Thalassospira profundimaris]|uniref:Flagellar protein FlgN n=1 Tax=Thalassospira profundimaris TaxID=502049 RepID=A0A367WM03_9PROT|nr:hypothetical protein [Thalassospira profundimaris]RCK41482.1 hypothetical protein TH30_21970 [Thalassospira profundimaris]